jgi:hypothetical protein
VLHPVAVTKLMSRKLSGYREHQSMVEYKKSFGWALVDQHQLTVMVSELLL